ncbi:MAG TPA: hypothetical protein VN328_08620 [Thermodesulfovibrionales bacterium]|nr:hypothetical protein [Thermodesulfovibrionales bacterium]
MTMPVKALAEDWISHTVKKNSEVFSELDVLLRALDRFFNIENLPLSKEDVSGKNFFNETGAVKDTILRVVGLFDMLIPENKKNIYWFQKFAQSKLLSDKKRDALREELYKQDVPEKSLFLLYDSFVNLKGIITDIMKTDHIPYLTFANIGQILGRELRENVHFNPFRHEFNPQFDVIENSEISRVVKEISAKDMKKHVSVILLHLFKFLRYLRYADASTRFGSFNSSLLIILLLRSEVVMFIGYLDTVVRKVTDEQFKMLMKAISYQFSMESKRVFMQELREVFRNKSPQFLKGRIENSHGILKNLTEQSTIQLVHFFAPDIKDGDIFETYIPRVEQSLRLREDILVLHRFLSLLEEATAEEKARVFDAMRNFMLYFQSFTFKLLRYDDYEEFASFFTKVLGFNRNEVRGKGFDKLADKIRQFRIFIETCLRQIANRADLAGVPVDKKRIENSLSQYLG